jgi:hypothetical protein
VDLGRPVALRARWIPIRVLPQRVARRSPAVTILTDAELLLGLSCHLAAYSRGPERAGLGELEFAGWVLDVGFRLQGSTISPFVRVEVIGLDVGLTGRDLAAVLATLEGMAWSTVARDAGGAPQAVSDRLPSLSELVEAASRRPERWSEGACSPRATSSYSTATLVGL